MLNMIFEIKVQAYEHVTHLDPYSHIIFIVKFVQASPLKVP